MVRHVRILFTNGRSVIVPEHYRDFCFSRALNISVNCFFMKTCSFRDAKPRLAQETIFSLMAPEARYGMKRCREQSCRCCYERLDLTHRFEPAMNISPKQSHCFVNLYRIYLNCDVVSAIGRRIVFCKDDLNLDLFNVQYYVCTDVSMSTI